MKWMVILLLLLGAYYMLLTQVTGIALKQAQQINTVYQYVESNALQLAGGN